MMGAAELMPKCRLVDMVGREENMTNDDRVEETEAGATVELGGTDEFETVDELLLI